MIFCVGGRGSTGEPYRTVECYDPRTNKWLPMAEMSSKRRHVGVIACSCKLCVCFLLPPDYIGLLLFGAALLSRRLCLHVSSRLHFRYAIGGHDGHEHLSSGECFDPRINRWSRISSMSTKRCATDD